MFGVSLDVMNLLHVCHDIRMKHVKLDNDYIWNRQFLVHLSFFFSSCHLGKTHDNFVILDFWPVSIACCLCNWKCGLCQGDFGSWS